jgi:protein-tyrosine kinase
MGKTHEALERAEKEYQENYLETADGSDKFVVSKEPGKFPMQVSSDRYQEVKTKLITSFPIGSVKTILFTGSAQGDGCTTTAASFANTLAQNCRLNVLLIDANLRSPRLHEVFNVQYNQGLADLLTLEEGISLFKKVGHGNLYLIPSGKENSGPLTIFESRRFEKILKQMREKFDYVILDAPPVNSYAETKVMGKIVDGVILVIKSGNTRKQVAIRAKQELEDAGAKVLGVILNRRKHYIPKWLYNRL